MTMPEPDIELITCHGWGLSPAVWKEWEKFLPAEVQVCHQDRGYFRPKKNPRFRYGQSRKILIVHSFGLHWCPVDLLSEADHLIIAGGFVSFHPDHPEDDRRSRFVLR